MSMKIQHNTGKRYVSGNSLEFICYLTTEKGKKSLADAGLPVRLCPFFLVFRRKNDGLWHFDLNDSRNSLARNCLQCKCPHICSGCKFLTFFMQDLVNKGTISAIGPKKADAKNMLATLTHVVRGKRAVATAVNRVLYLNPEGMLEMDQKVEGYVRHLNSNGQYAVLLYSDYQLITPGNLTSTQKVRYRSNKDEALFTRPYSLGIGRSYWDSFSEVDPSSEEKTVYMTFEAVTLAVESYLLSFPVICLDACTIKSPNTSAVLPNCFIRNN